MVPPSAHREKRLPRRAKPYRERRLVRGGDSVELTPDFSLPGVDGEKYSLASFKDKPVLVVAFWCNHCPYVQAWEERTIATQRDYAGKGVQFVMINANDEEGYPEDDFPNMVERSKRKGYNFP